MQIKNSGILKTRVTTVEQRDKVKYGGTIRIRMCECNFKIPIWVHFLKNGG